MNRDLLAGFAFALGAFTIWGLFPVYWKLLGHVDTLEILAHRVSWSVPFIAVVILARRHGAVVLEVLRRPRELALLAATAALISINWGIYIWAVAEERVVEASMGYFLTPLINVVFGLAMFRERLAGAQWLAVAIAACGVGALIFVHGTLPWVALALGMSFAAYGALRKKARSDSITGLLIETLLVSPLAWGYLLLTPGGAFGTVSLSTNLLLIGAGAVTATPLLLFVAAARRLHYSTVGLVFYLTPSMQFVLGVFVYGEPLRSAELFAFACIWTALALFASHGFVTARRAPAAT